MMKAKRSLILKYIDWLRLQLQSKLLTSHSVFLREEYKAMESDHLGVSLALGIPIGVIKIKLE